MRFLSMLVATAALSIAQGPLVTTFANNNSGSVGGAVYFNLTAIDPAGITICQLDINLNSAAGTAGTIDLFTQPGSSIPHMPIGGWTLVSAGDAVTAAGAGTPVPVILSTPLFIAGGTTVGVALRANGVAHAYTNGVNPYPVPGNVFATADLSLNAGQASNVPFTGAAFTPRVVNCRLHYGIGPLAVCGAVIRQGPGCGTPPLSLDPVGLPIQSPAAVAFDVTTGNIPTTALLHLGIVGLNRPGLPLAPFGAPSCILNSSLDVVVGPAIGPFGPTLTWTALTLPAAPSFANFQFNAQGAILGTPLNGAFGVGMLTSNGLKCSVGAAPSIVVNGVNNQNPTAGAQIVLTGAGFGPNPKKCNIGILGDTVDPTGTQLTGTVMNKTGTFMLEIGEFLPGDFTTFGPGGIPFVVPPGVGVLPGGCGVVGTIDPTTIVQTGIPITVMAAGASTDLPVVIDGLGRICIDFSNTAWMGGEEVEIELHFDINPAPAVGFPHCDFFATRMTIPVPGTAANCAALVALFCVLNIQIQCPGISFTVIGDTMYIVPPPGQMFRNLHPWSHVTVI